MEQIKETAKTLMGTRHFGICSNFESSKSIYLSRFETYASLRSPRFVVACLKTAIARALLRPRKQAKISPIPLVHPLKWVQFDHLWVSWHW